MTDHLEAAIQAGADAVEAEATATAFNTPTAWVPADDAKIIITAALPSLRLHVLNEELERAEKVCAAKMRNHRAMDPDEARAFQARSFLRARIDELEGSDV